MLTLGSMLQDQAQGGFDGLIAHLFPGSFKAAMLYDGLRFIAETDKNRANGVAVFIPAGARKTGDGNRSVSV